MNDDYADEYTVTLPNGDTLAVQYTGQWVSGASGKACSTRNQAMFAEAREYLYARCEDNDDAAVEALLATATEN